MNDVRFLCAGDTALVMELGNIIDEGVNTLVNRVADSLATMPIKGVVEVVPTFRSLLVYYKPEIITFTKLKSKLTQLLIDCNNATDKARRIVHIPVLYGGEYGEDMPFVMEHSGLSEQEVIAAHSGRDYLIYMLGFLPGFAYLGGMDARLITPRLKNPRTKIPAGSVGIGGEQTGIYPIASPGGWQLIGRTPTRPYEPSKAQPFLYKAGDYIRFEPITQAQYNAIEQDVASGNYIVAVEVL